ncbi:MAG: HAD-IA family hydrolase [Muribaculaceae bacterium]|nr:HAD-IA family hydrolase [Muribaculaceae bacterium]
MANVKNLIFDFDGTLVDTAPLIIKTMQATMRVMDLPLRDNNECRAIIGLRLEDIPNILWPEIKGIGHEFSKTYRSIFDELKHPLNVVCYPKVTKTLRYLLSEGYGLAVASSRNHKSLHEFLRLYGISDCFSTVIGGDDIENGKPAPDTVLKILSLEGWAPEETMIVGDAEFDIIMGKKAGVHTCGVTYGNGSIHELTAAKPDYMIPRFDDLISILH